MKIKLFSIASLFILTFLALFVLPIQVEARSSYNVRSYRTPSLRMPSMRNYSNGGSLRLQSGYIRSNGTYVQPHLKTSPDSTIYNNRKYLLGY